MMWELYKHTHTHTLFFAWHFIPSEIENVSIHYKNDHGHDVDDVDDVEQKPNSEEENELSHVYMKCKRVQHTSDIPNGIDISRSQFLSLFFFVSLCFVSIEFQRTYRMYE